jgi:hypothetical protein
MMGYHADGICHNSEPGTYGHECGKPAVWLGTKENGWQCGFCDHCRHHGFEAKDMMTWEPMPRIQYFNGAEAFSDEK